MGKRGWKSERGMSVYETVIMVTALSAMTAMATSVGGDLLERSRLVTGRQQVLALGTAMQLMLADHLGHLPVEGAEMLASSGTAPEGHGWSAPVDGSKVVDMVEALFANGIGLPEPIRANDPGWRGPYLTNEIGPDPWGGRFMVSLGSNDGRTGAVVAMSAGPDGVAQVPYGQMPAPGSTGDDISFIVQY